MGVCTGKYRTGIGHIDAQHEGLFQLLSELKQMAISNQDKDALLNLFEVFLKNVKIHFSTEEQLLLENDYPGYFKQRSDHTAMLEYFEQAKSRLGVLSPEAAVALFEQHYETLEKHCAGADLAYGEFLSDKGIR